MVYCTREAQTGKVTSKREGDLNLTLQQNPSDDVADNKHAGQATAVREELAVTPRKRSTVPVQRHTGDRQAPVTNRTPS